jgi:hypothetical protein
MDCKTFDDHLMDELYGELDEVTSAAMARHAESCPASPSCATKLAGLRSAREAVTVEMPYVDPPEDLEDRILAATRDARPVVPLRRKVGGAVSWAGAWAMRPQTAMAAVFLLMIGSSLAFLRTHRSSKSAESSNAVAVSDMGKPELSTPPAEQAGQADPPSAAPPSVAAATPLPAPAVPMATSAAIGSLDEAKDDSSPRGRAAAPAAPAASALALNGYDGDSKVAPSKSAPAYHSTSTGGAAVNDPSDQPRSALRKGEAVATRAAATKPKADTEAADLEQAGNAAPGAPPSQAQAASQAASSDDAFTRGQQAYAARRFDEARDDFDAASGGNVSAALWAARSVRDGQGCASAVSRFDDVVNRAPSSAVGFDARLEGARCYRALGKTDAARARLVPLLTVPSHATRAQAELASMAPPPALKKAAPGGTSGP